jgi:hypothetical protein
MIEIKPLTLEDALLVAGNIRRADALELEALGFRSPFAGIWESWRNSAQAWAGYLDQTPLGVFGYAVPQIIGRGCMPWMITTENVERHRVAFARASVKINALLLEEFSACENWVDARHLVCIRWLRWLKFEVHPAQPLPPRGLLFHRFSSKGTS